MHQLSSRAWRLAGAAVLLGGLLLAIRDAVRENPDMEGVHPKEVHAGQEEKAEPAGWLEARSQASSAKADRAIGPIAGAASTPAVSSYRSSLAAVFQQALQSSASPDRFFALRIAAICSVLPGIPVVIDADRASDATGSPADLSLRKRVQEDREQLLRYCRTGDGDAFLKSARAAGKPFLSTVDAGLTRKHQQFEAFQQAATLVLSSPETYPWQFNVWLAFNLHLPDPLLSHAQRDLLETTLFSRFVKDPEMQQIRLLERCAVLSRCGQDQSLPESERDTALAIANQVERLIREQRWDQLLPSQR